jgi:hypothetical protein
MPPLVPAQTIWGLKRAYGSPFFPLVRKKTIGVHIEAGRQPPGSKVVGCMISVLYSDPNSSIGALKKG